MKMKKAKVTIKGISPLLFNRFAEAELDPAPGPKEPNKIKDPANKLYRLPDGKIYTPYTHIQGSLTDAAKQFQIKGNKRSTYSKLFGSQVEINPDAIVHKHQGWDVFSISAVNPSTRGRIMTHRPMLKEWELDFIIDYNTDAIPDEVLKSVMDYAGLYVGIGDWRPDKKGKFGKFMVTKFEV